MGTIRIGILGTSEIAFRRFLPALKKCPEFEYIGIASRTQEKGKVFADSFGGTVYDEYDALLADRSIDAVYIPLPPALHFEWGKKALEAGKHVLMEKPFTTTAKDTGALLAIAEKKGIAVHENYMFLYHSQLAWIDEQLKAGTIGELRLIRSAFGFPKRGETDFRYNKMLGGGALLDCGGYPVRLAFYFMGEGTHVIAARLNSPDGYNVDLFGSVMLENRAGQVAQISFGMDNSYKCELELWGSKGCLKADRIFTAPAGFAPEVTLHTVQGVQQITLSVDDSFQNSIRVFSHIIEHFSSRITEMHKIMHQSELVEKILSISKM